MSSVLKSFTAVGVARSIKVEFGLELTYAVSGTFVGKVVVETSKDGGLTWQILRTLTTTGTGGLRCETPGGALFRFRCSAYTSGTIGAVIFGPTKVLFELKNDAGVVVLKVTETAIVFGGTLTLPSPLVTGDATFLGGMTVEGAIAAGGAITGTDFGAGSGNPAVFKQASAEGQAAIAFGMDNAEGLRLKVIEETIDLTDLGEAFVALTTPVPAGAVILGAQAHILEDVVAGGTGVKIALGLNAGDVDKYGISADLLQDTQFKKLSAHAVLSAPEQIDLCVVATDGSALGDEDITAGSVRVRVYYWEIADLTVPEPEE